MRPGEVWTPPGEVQLVPGRERRRVSVVNKGDRPIQIGSHFHFADVNPALEFERSAAVGFRLDIPAGTAFRFEPGVDLEIHLVSLAGARSVPGLRLRK